jgi:hypothetical protein
MFVVEIKSLTLCSNAPAFDRRSLVPVFGRGALNVGVRLRDSPLPSTPFNLATQPMIKPVEAEAILDASSCLRLARPKEKNSAVYVTKNGRYLALERRLKTITKIHIEPAINPLSLELSAETTIEHLPPSVPRVHLPAATLTGPYEGRSGNEAWRIRVGSEQDIRTIVAAYGVA